MAKGARCDVNQLRHVFVFRVLCVAEATVDGDLMMEAVTSDAAFLLYGHGRGYVAGVTTESHGQMGIVEEGFGGEGEGVALGSRVTETARTGGVGNVVAVVARFRGRQGEAPVFGH
jgi:hypothetical protein